MWPRTVLHRHPAMGVLVALLAVVALVVAAWGWHLNRQLDAIPRFSVDLQRSERPAPTAQGTTLLLAGVDNPEAAGTLLTTLQQPDWPAGVFRSDAIMVLHISPGHQEVQLVSIPRDTWVSVPGYGQQKINAAFSYGGPELLAETVENYTDTRIDHIVVVDMAGFVSIAETLGGVQVQVDGRTRTLQAAEALRYVRERKDLPRGDFDRIQRQQNVLRSILTEVASAGTLANPVRLTQLVNDLSDYLAVDAGLTNGRLLSLALDSRTIRADDVEFVTVPVRGTDYVQGQSIVRGDRQATRAMFDAIAQGDFAVWLADHPVDQLPALGKVD